MPSASPETEVPSRNPSVIPELLSIPDAGTNSTITLAGIKRISHATVDTYCGIFIQKSDGSLIPYARSYNQYNWESSPGPYACASSKIDCSSGTTCDVDLSVLTDTDDKYIIISMDDTAVSTSDTKMIAQWLQLITFGPRKSEIVALDTGTFGAAERAAHVRNQIDMPATSHREYWRKRANPKWDDSSIPGRSNHPCSPYSKWRRYAFIKQDRKSTITNIDNSLEFEIVPDNSSPAIYEADSTADADVLKGNTGFGSSGNTPGFSGTGYYSMGGSNDFIEWSVNVPSTGDYQIMIRYAQNR